MENVLRNIIEVIIVNDEIKRLDGSEENPSFEECMETAKLLCVTYHQNCVLVKNSTTDKLFLVIRDAHLQNETNKTIRL